jgi:hypothetical protein
MRCAAIAMAALSATAAIGAAPDYQVTRQVTSASMLHFARAGIPTLDLRVIHGSIRVMGSSDADVRLSTAMTVAAESEAAIDDALRDVVLDTIDDASTVGVIVREPNRTSCGEPGNGRSPAWWDRVRYRVTVDLAARVPVGTRVRLCTIDGREAQVDNVAGDFDVTNVNGQITLSDMRGSGRAATVNGAVTATFSATPREPSEFKTVNGNVTVTFPTTLSADLRLKTFHGGLFTDFDVTPVAQLASASTERRNGRFVYRSNQYTSVRAGSGGTEITLETLNGDVRVLHGTR